MSDITVLVVDDEARMRKLIKDFLMQKGYSILEAGDGEEALKIFGMKGLKIFSVSVVDCEIWQNFKPMRSAFDRFDKAKFDLFFIVSHGIAFTHNDKAKNYPDVLFDNLNYDNSGTIVYMMLNNDSVRNLSDVFNMFAGDDYGFDKTVIPINLARYGDDNLVSRSQAKRVLARVQLFKHVVFDFAGIPQIGQAFADEIFRVFHNANPNIELEYINANENVINMIKRAQVSNI